jgi:adenylylsulfate kinase
MPIKILIMGLPGSGKTYFAERLKIYLENNSTLDNIPLWRFSQFETVPVYYKVSVDWFNADEIRKKFNDWDFSNDGRIRQSIRMAQFALKCSSDYVICDFVAPLQEMRDNFSADWTIWMDTIEAGRFEDTNKIFIQPEKYDFRIKEKNAEHWVNVVGSHILSNRRYTGINQTKEYHIRFNTKHGDSDLYWRVFEDGIEHLVKSFNITVPVRDSSTMENGVKKWNVYCRGNMKIIDDIAYID